MGNLLYRRVQFSGVAAKARFVCVVVMRAHSSLR